MKKLYGKEIATLIRFESNSNQYQHQQVITYAFEFLHTNCVLPYILELLILEAST